MNRRNFALSTFAVLALGLTPLSACSKDKGGGGASGEGGSMLSYLPQDTSMVVGLSFAKGRSSELVKKYQEKFLSEMPAELKELKDKCGFDPINDINTVIMSMGKDPQDDSDMAIAVKGKFDKAKIDKCVTDMGGKVAEGKITSPDGEEINVTWPAADTMVISKGISAADLEKAKGASIKENKEVMAVVNKVDSGAAVWIAGKIPGEAAGMMGPITPPSSLYVSFNVGSGLDVKAGLMFNSADDAKAASSMAEMGLNMAKAEAGPFKDIIEGVKMSTDGKLMTIKAKLSGKQIESLESMAGNLPF